MLDIQKKLTNSFYALLSLPATAMGFALSIQIAVLSWILNTKYGLDIHEIGIVWAAGPIAGIFGQVIIALTLDLAINISFNPTRSIIADVTPDGVPRTKGYTWMQTISRFFGVMAYAIGAIIGNYFLIYSGAVLVLLFSLVPPFFIEENRELTSEQNTSDTVTKSNVTQWGQLFRIYFAHGFSWIGVQTMFVYIIAYIQQKLNPADQTETGQIIAISFLVLNAV